MPALDHPVVRVRMGNLPTGIGPSDIDPIADVGTAVTPNLFQGPSLALTCRDKGAKWMLEENWSDTNPAAKLPLRDRSLLVMRLAFYCSVYHWPVPTDLSLEYQCMVKPPRVPLNSPSVASNAPTQPSGVPGPGSPSQLQP